MGLSRVSKCLYQVNTLIIGLGNPTIFYQKTRHNVGKNFIDYVADKYKLKFDSIKGGEIVYMKQSGDSGYVAFFKTDSFMNTSGSPTKHAMKFCGITSLQNVIVVTDDLDQNFGKFRLKQGGSPQGHNGLKSIIETNGGDKNFRRLLLGIGRPDSKDPSDIANYVTSNMDRESLHDLNNTVFPAALEFLNKEAALSLTL